MAEASLEKAMAEGANEQITNERERVAESIAVRGYDFGFDPTRVNWPN